MSAEVITWHDAITDPPDDEQTVLIRSVRLDPPVWTGYLSAGMWLTTDADIVRDVTHWAHLPERPLLDHCRGGRPIHERDE